MQWIKWSLFLLMAGLLTWRIIILGMAEYHFQADDPQAAAKALAWHSRHPGALLEQAGRLGDSDIDTAEALLRRAVWENPAQGSAYLALARLRESREQARQAEELVARADYLAPMRGAVQWGAASFWTRQGRVDLAMQHWSRTLRLRPQVRDQLYPALIRLAEDPQLRLAFGPLLKEPPPWWESFFSYAATNVISLDSLRVLYQLRQQQGGKPGIKEQRAYLARLQKEEQWLEAYFAWLNGLDSPQLTVLGNIYNGGFELPLADEGYGWRAPRVRGVTVDTSPTYGITGSKALQVIFRGRQVRFRHLYQYLLLEPGAYRLQGQVRPDSLDTPRGVQWAVRCATETGSVLGMSEHFLGTDQWRTFTTVFEIPAEGCPVQLLRLELAGRIASEFQAQGTLWFDELAIIRLD